MRESACSIVTLPGGAKHCRTLLRRHRFRKAISPFDSLRVLERLSSIQADRVNLVHDARCSVTNPHHLGTSMPSEEGIQPITPGDRSSSIIVKLIYLE